MQFLLIRLRLVGDVVFTTPAVKALRQHYPDAHITYVVEPAAAPVVAANPHINRLLVVPRGRGPTHVAREVALLWQLRRARYDVVIDFHGGPRSSLLAWATGAPIRIGYDVVGRAWMYTRQVRRPRELRPRHSVENQADLLHALNVPLPLDRTQFPVEMFVDGQTKADTLARLATAGADGAANLIVMHVSANSPFRRWPLASFAAVAASLAAADERRRILVTSGPSEPLAATEVIARARALLRPALQERVLSCGELSLAELRIACGSAALFIGGDSGPLHVASTSGVPIVALFGPTLPERSRPWRAPHYLDEAVDSGPLECRPCDQRVCAPGDFRCLQWIDPPKVIAAAERVLARAVATPAPLLKTH